MKLLLSIFSILLFCSCAYSSEIECFKKGLNSQGKPYFEKMHETGEFDYVLYLIEYGNAEAIKFSPQLKTFSDASTTEAIIISLSRALNKNPLAVLEVMPNNFTVEEICAIPFIEAPMDIQNIHVNQAIYNIQQLGELSGGLEKIKQNCLSAFKKIQDQNITIKDK